MEDDYLINDTRIIDDLKKTTFGGYKKKDVYTVLFKSIETKKIENACNWLTECLCSGYFEETWQKLLCFSSNIITINNPHLPNYLYKKNAYSEEQTHVVFKLYCIYRKCIHSL